VGAEGQVSATYRACLPGITEFMSYCSYHRAGNAASRSIGQVIEAVKASWRASGSEHVRNHDSVVKSYFSGVDIVLIGTYNTVETASSLRTMASGSGNGCCGFQ